MPEIPCERCDGSGEIVTSRGATEADDEYVICPDCGGTGDLDDPDASQGPVT